jgi:hypothetical protein
MVCRFFAYAFDLGFREPDVPHLLPKLQREESNIHTRASTPSAWLQYPLRLLRCLLRGIRPGFLALAAPIYFQGTKPHEQN